MAAPPKALLLLGVLLTSLLLLSSHVTDAAEGKQTNETRLEAAGDTVVDSNLNVCSFFRCCDFQRMGFGWHCGHCCLAEEETPAHVADAVDGNGIVCKCCHAVRTTDGVRCLRVCCRDGKEIAVDEVVADEPQN